MMTWEPRRCQEFRVHLGKGKPNSLDRQVGLEPDRPQPALDNPLHIRRIDLTHQQRGSALATTTWRIYFICTFILQVCASRANLQFTDCRFPGFTSVSYVHVLCTALWTTPPNPSSIQSRNFDPNPVTRAASGPIHWRFSPGHYIENFPPAADSFRRRTLSYYALGAASVPPVWTCFIIRDGRHIRSRSWKWPDHSAPIGTHRRRPAPLTAWQGLVACILGMRQAWDEEH